MEDQIIPSEEVNCMFTEGKKKITADEQLALFMHKFNLDIDTVEIMPAFEHHFKELTHKELNK